jgi:anaerobic ribonucleoside-triphosphate reductase
MTDSILPHPVLSLPREALKRDGRRVPFDSEKIRSALQRAGQAAGEFDADEANLLSAQVTKVLIHRFHGQPPSIEQIQDVVEQTLIAANHLKTARAYIVYREQHAKLRADRKTLVDVESSINEYLNRQDWRVNANANQGYSLGGLILNVSGKVTANYWLSHVYAPEVGEAHRRATSTSTTSTCWPATAPAGRCARCCTRASTACPARSRRDRRNTCPPPSGRSSTSWARCRTSGPGAQAFSSFDTYMAPFVRKDNLAYDAVRQCHPGAGLQPQRAVALGHPDTVHQSHLSTGPARTTCGTDARDRRRGNAVCYGDLQAEMDMINRAYIDVMTTGDAKGRAFTFPIPTYNITPDFPWDSKNADRLFDMTAKYGLPYFQNFVNSELKPNMVRSMCCRLQLDLRELLKRGNGLFGSAEQTGSLGVVTINCARLGYLHKGDEAALLARWTALLELGATAWRSSAR